MRWLILKRLRFTSLPVLFKVKFSCKTFLNVSLISYLLDCVVIIFPIFRRLVKTSVMFLTNWSKFYRFIAVKIIISQALWWIVVFISSFVSSSLLHLSYSVAHLCHVAGNLRLNSQWLKISGSRWAGNHVFIFGKTYISAWPYQRNIWQKCFLATSLKDLFQIVGSRRITDIIEENHFYSRRFSIVY